MGFEPHVVSIWSRKEFRSDNERLLQVKEAVTSKPL